MNVGQILETHLGWAARILGFEAKTPVFRGADEAEIGVLLRLAGFRWAARGAPAPARRRRRSTPAAITRLVHDLKKVGAEGRAHHAAARPAIAMLGARSASAETRELFQAGPRVPGRRGQGAGRARAGAAPPGGRVPPGAGRGRDAEAAKAARQGAQGAREGRRGRRRPRRWRRRASRRWPALLGGKSEARRGRGGGRAAPHRRAHPGRQGPAARRPDRPARSRARSRSARSTC